LETRLQQAQTLHRSGNLLAAEPLYEDILRAQPDQFEALHGSLRSSTGRPSAALH
jgi:hypothetical protein